MNAREADNALLDELADLGIDLNRPREVRFHFMFNVRLGAQAVQARLTEDGYDCELTKQDHNFLVRLFKRSEWLLAATKVMVVDCYIISELRKAFTMMMDESGGFYDGWEVEVFPEEQHAL